MSSVLITGAGRGLGREILEVYGRNGWSLFPLVRDEKVAKELETVYAPRCHAIVGDVTDDNIEKAIAKVIDKHGGVLDLLINNAGNIRKNRGIEKADPNDLLDIFNVHGAGAARCVRAALPFLKKSPRAVIVNISSRFGSISHVLETEWDFVYAYCMAKCAQNMLTACLHQELKKFNIKVLAVHPGRLKTSVAPADADTEPQVAAEKLYEWLATVDDKTECRLYDLMAGKVIDW
ncbi:conserved hypothetical protein [Candidatus Zixiibacteriota bacterium]|nr:conserved hypothetical protein [candidate division Zixibacteria bacterium]